MIKRVVYYGFSRKAGRVSPVFGRPRQHRLSLFHQNSTIFNQDSTIIYAILSNIYQM
ncbi:hypothetical protein Hanom_Chr01g00039381 [Helianthus anomalus]